MAEKNQYRTRQRENLLRYLAEHPYKHFTAADICEHFRTGEQKIGTTTVYRQLERLVSEGQVKKYQFEEGDSACFEYIGGEEDDTVLCYHLKCEVCGRLIHLECREITMFEQHITEHHGFLIDPKRTVFYGICQDCRAPEKEA
ncbi:MAG: transcriptional repressor [Lachnospiraceae bacterium]|nr:transcriptional repressor [Lachnospiraceae bacterium]